MNKWTEILTAPQIEEHFEQTARLDPRTARLEKEWWMSRTVDQLEIHKGRCWRIPDADGYQMAQSLIAQHGET